MASGNFSAVARKARRWESWPSGFRSLGLHLSVFAGLLGGGNGPIGIAYLEAGEAADGDVLAEFADLLRDELRDGDGLLLDEGLVQQADLLVELAHLAFDDLLDDWRGLAGCRGLGAIDFLFALHVLGGDILFADVAGIGRSDVHRDVLEQLLKILGAGDKVGFAIQFDEHADLAAGVNVGADRALIGRASSLLLRGGDAALS